MDETKHGLIVDLNRHRPGRNLRQMVDAGVDGFIFRIGGPAQWTEGSWGYAEDPTWRPYLEQADKIGIPRAQIGGYVVHNPFEDWRLARNIHLDCLNQWTGGGYTPGYYVVDHEVATCWRGAAKITATPYNLVSSLSALMDALWKTLRRPVLVYTARWFLDGNGPLEHVTRLDNINGPATGKQWGMWYAAYLHQAVFASKQFASARDALTGLPTPTGDQVGRYLQAGSYSLYDLWQFTDRLKIGGDAVGVDASVTRGTLAEYWRLVGADQEVPTEPEIPVEEEPATPVDGDGLARVLAALVVLDGRLAALAARLDQIFR